MYGAGKIPNMFQEIERLKINILELNETRLLGSRNLQIKHARIFYTVVVE